MVEVGSGLESESLLLLPTELLPMSRLGFKLESGLAPVLVLSLARLSSFSSTVIFLRAFQSPI